MYTFICKQCGNEFKGKLNQMYCPRCVDTTLFSIAKDYIRENDVNEFQLADKLDIPLSTVKNWIREGKITYKTPEDNKNYIPLVKCQICGASISFGTICTRCIHQQKVKAIYNGNIHDKEQMRFLDDYSKKNK